MSPEPYVLYFTHFSRYVKCGQKFLWYKGWPGIDLGRGDGKGKAFPEKRSEHNALMGSVTQKIVEYLYNDLLWKQFQGKPLRQHLDKLTQETFNRKIQKRHIKWGKRFDQASSRHDLLEVCVQGVRGYLKTMRHNKLLGPYAKCEVKLIGHLDETTSVGGVVDLIIQRDADSKDLPGTTILDGKNASKKNNQWTEPDQVRWYALCMYLEKGVLPDRVGFVYYRYPYGTPVMVKDPKTKEMNPTGEIDSGVTWVDFDMEDLEGLAERARQAVAGMNALQFEPNPSPKTCLYCDFEKVCPERVAQRAANAAKRKKSNSPKKRKRDALLAKTLAAGGVLDM